MAEDWYSLDPYPDEPSFSSRSRRSTSEASQRRRGHYETQRGSAPPPPSSQSQQSHSGSSSGQQPRPKSKSKANTPTYDEPASFHNLDETAVPPPVGNPDDRRTYQRESALEDDLDPPGRGTTSRSAKPAKSSSHGQSFSRKRKSHAPTGEGELTEVAAPPPIQKDLDEEAAVGGVGQEDYLEDAEAGEETSDEPSLPYDNHEPQEENEGGEEVPRFLTELYTVSYLILFAIWGTLARLGTQWITFYPGTPMVTPVIWANMGGSIILGFLAEDQCLFLEKSTSSMAAEKKKRRSKIAKGMEEDAKASATKRKKAIPLYIGLATGFCGSYTSFSSFIRDVFLGLSNKLPTPINHPHPGHPAPLTSSTVGRSGGYSFEAALQIVILTLALAVGGLITGAQFAIFLDPFTPRIHGSFVAKYIDKLAVVLAFGCWLGAVLLTIWPPDRFAPVETWRGDALFAITFAPLGCLLRFYVSMHLNGLIAAFPLGTFFVNMLGTAVEGMCFDLQHAGLGSAGAIGGSLLGCQVLQGVMDGFCGALTTVSTFVAEVNGLKRKHGWWYAGGSVLGGLCLMVVIMGGVTYSIGYSEPVCNTGYPSKIH